MQCTSMYRNVQSKKKLKKINFLGNGSRAFWWHHHMTPPFSQVLSVVPLSQQRLEYLSFFDPYFHLSIIIFPKYISRFKIIECFRSWMAKISDLRHFPVSSKSKHCILKYDVELAMSDNWFPVFIDSINSFYFHWHHLRKNHNDCDSCHNCIWLIEYINVLVSCLKIYILYYW